MSDAVELTGLLLREGGGFLLRGDDGREWRLLLSRVPVDLVAKRVRVTGTVDTADTILADGVRAV